MVDDESLDQEFTCHTVDGQEAPVWHEAGGEWVIDVLEGTLRQ